jgi:hypothetical protein
MKIRLMLSLITLVMLWGCSGSLKVIADYNGGLDFSKYNTYNFYEPDTVIHHNELPAIVNPLNQRRIEKAIVEEMELRGYTRSADPDVLITYFLKIEDKTEYSATSYNYYNPYYGGYGYYGYYGGYGYGWTEVTAYDYKVGTLVVDLVDGRTNELIWYGAGSKALNGAPRHPEQEINDAITHIFYQYRFIAGEAEPLKSAPRK